MITEICISLLKNLITSIISTAQLHSIKPEIMFCAVSNPARSVVEIRDGEDLWQWSRLEIRLNAIRRSTILQKQHIKENTANKTKYVLVENELKKLQTYHSSLFACQSYFLNDGSQNLLIYQPIFKTFTALAGLSDTIVEWKSKGVLNEKIKPPITAIHSFSPKLTWMNNSRRRTRFTGNCLKQDKVTFNWRNAVNLFIVYELDKRSQDLNADLFKY